MAKEIITLPLQLEALAGEPAIHEGIIEYPRVESTRGKVRIIHTINEAAQQRAVGNYTHLIKIPEMSPILPTFVAPITLPSVSLLVIDEYAPDDSFVAVRTMGANHNVYTGNTKILDEAEQYFRERGQTDHNGRGTIPELTRQANQVEQLLRKHQLTARMSAFSVVIQQTNDQRQPFRTVVKIRDLAQVTRHLDALEGYPIWGVDCFWGMINTALWFHNTYPAHNTSV